MCDTCGCKGAEEFKAEDAFRGMRKGSTKIIEGFDAQNDGKNYRGKSVNYELIPSVEIEGVGVVSEGSPYLKNNYDVKWDEYDLYDDDAGEVILSIPTNHPRMPLQEGELELITAMVYGFDHPLADASWGELNERGMFWATKTMETLANYDGFDAETFEAESPFKSDAFNEGRSAGITFYTPESTKEDYYANLDTEYMIHYGLSPEDLLNDVENKSPRYLQFIAGFDDGWNYSTLLHEDVIVETTDGDDMEEIDYEMAGEYFTDYPKGMREHISQTSKEFTLDGLMALGVIASIVGFGFFRNKIMNAEVRLAEESCSGDDDCPEGKACVDGRCLPICEDDGDCASWQECRDDLHPTEKVCGEQSTDSFQELTTPKPKPQPEVQQDPPKAKESMFNPVSIAIGGGIVAVAVIGMNYLGNKKESE
jgi:hypothetical protein